MHLRREILIRDFNKRELIVLELIHELTVDMKRESVELYPSEFAVVGIDKSKIQSVLTNLVKNQVLVIEGHQFRINQTVTDWQVEVGKGYTKKKFYQLVYSGDNPTQPEQLSSSQPSSQNSNNQPEPGCQNSNVQEAASCQKSNTTGSQNGNSGIVYINNNINNKKQGGTSYPRDNAGSPPTLLALFKTEFKTALEAEYNPNWKKDGKLMADLAKTYGEAKLRELIPLFFQLYRSDSFLRDSAMSVGVFYSQINKLIVAARKEVNRIEHNNNQSENIHKASNADYFRALQSA
jgi:hypothetical protein